jgi:hypothetical protein
MRYGWERWGTLGGDYDVWDDTEDDCDYDDDEELEFGEDEQ